MWCTPRPAAPRPGIHYLLVKMPSAHVAGTAWRYAITDCTSLSRAHSSLLGEEATESGRLPRVDLSSSRRFTLVPIGLAFGSGLPFFLFIIARHLHLRTKQIRQVLMLLPGLVLGQGLGACAGLEILEGLG